MRPMPPPPPPRRGSRCCRRCAGCRRRPRKGCSAPRARSARCSRRCAPASPHWPRRPGMIPPHPPGAPPGCRKPPPPWRPPRRALAAGPTVLRLAAETGAPAAAAAAAWAEVGGAFRIEALRQAAAAAPAPGAFGPRARAALLEDLGAAQASLAVARLRGAVPDGAAVAQLAQEAAQAGDLAAIGVAARALRAMA
ncbi:hypothetical protein [Dankookia sp. P2]|uniref:hypothetical protein n=1 Tax=Dankookia sp. P2 TaxID=3423955 RepID=UPI003D67F9B5